MFPRYGTVLGGTVVQVTGPCFDAYADHDFVCFFDDVEVPAVYVDNSSIICVSPEFRKFGKVDFTLNITGTTIMFRKATFHSCKNVAI